MSAKKITLEGLNLTPGEAELFASGARHLFGLKTPTDETAPQDKPTDKKKAALAGIAIKSGSSPGKHPNGKEGKGKPK